MVVFLWEVVSGRWQAAGFGAMSYVLFFSCGIRDGFAFFRLGCGDDGVPWLAVDVMFIVIDTILVGVLEVVYR